MDFGIEVQETSGQEKPGSEGSLEEKKWFRGLGRFPFQYKQRINAKEKSKKKLNKITSLCY